MVSNPTPGKPSAESWRQLIRTLLLILLAVGVPLFAAISLGVATGKMRHPQSAVATIFSALSLVNSSRWACWSGCSGSGGKPYVI